MSVLNLLASAQGRRDEIPNQELAANIARTGDKKAVEELVQHLANKDKNIQSDCIKTLDEIGVLKPSLVSPYGQVFVDLLKSKNNRMIWGAMAALDNITPDIPKQVYSWLPAILDAADKGSVITRDRAMHILAQLAAIPAYADTAFPLLLDQMKGCPTNQLPMYAEQTLPIITKAHTADFRRILQSRLEEIESDSKRKRVEKVLKKLA